MYLRTDSSRSSSLLFIATTYSVQPVPRCAFVGGCRSVSTPHFPRYSLNKMMLMARHWLVELPSLRVTPPSLSPSPLNHKRRKQIQFSRSFSQLLIHHHQILRQNRADNFERGHVSRPSKPDPTHDTPLDMILHSIYAPSLFSVLLSSLHGKE